MAEGTEHGNRSKAPKEEIIEDDVSEGVNEDILAGMIAEGEVVDEPAALKKAISRKREQQEDFHEPKNKEVQHTGEASAPQSSKSTGVYQQIQNLFSNWLPPTVEEFLLYCMPFLVVALFALGFKYIFRSEYE